jgi:hypothetical protein
VENDYVQDGHDKDVREKRAEGREQRAEGRGQRAE